MGRRDKRKTKNVKGAALAKTIEKTDKKLAKQFKKILAEKGEDDIDAILAEFVKKEKVKPPSLEVTKECPTPRICATLTAHESKNRLYMFGGEFMDKKQHLYNDFYIFDAAANWNSNTEKNNEADRWTKYQCTPAPPPRSAHQSIFVDRDGGQLFVFGGEFTSPSQEQFKQYKDLWILSIKDLENKSNGPVWTQVLPAKATDPWPPARSGHRMVLHRKKIILFGGYLDTFKKLVFYNDLWSFDIDTMQWTEHKSRDMPCPRSASTFVVDSELMIAVLYGGLQITRDKKDNEKSIVLNDMWVLDLKNWQWSEKPKAGLPPSLRSGFAYAHCAAKKRMYLFGGVSDLETNLDLVSVFHDGIELIVEYLLFRYILVAIGEFALV